MAKKILIADDELFCRKILKFNFEKLGFEIFEAEDGIDTLNIIEHIMPDLVLLDLMMPKLTGFDVLEKMKQNPGLSNIPVIVLSAKTSKQDIDKVLSLGANKFIKKPYDLLSLRDEIIKILS